MKKTDESVTTRRCKYCFEYVIDTPIHWRSHYKDCHVLSNGKETTIFSKCKHQFFEIGRGKYRTEDYGFVDIVDQPNGIITMCALCGERRHLHADGRLEVLEKKDSG